jgi:hypothetical protein
VTADGFRRIALALEDVVESAHMGHPDFRLRGRIFATLHTDDKFGMVKLTPEQQQTFVTSHPDVYTPESGAWGRQGCTRVRLNVANAESVGEALTLAWQDAAARPAARVTARPVVRRMAAKKTAKRTGTKKTAAPRRKASALRRREPED